MCVAPPFATQTHTTTPFTSPEFYKILCIISTIYFYEKYEGDWDDIYKAIQRKERVDATEAKSFLKKYRNKYDYVTLIDNEYPDEYKANYKPPFVIRKRKNNDKNRNCRRR